MRQNISRISALVALCLMPFVTSAMTSEQALKSLQQSFTNSKIQDFRKAPIEGLYEVTLDGAQVIYFAPEDDVLIFGEIYSRDGRSLTAEAVARANQLRIDDLPYDQALILGPEDGIPIIEFTDPDCPYCLRYDEFIRNSEVPVKRVIFFMTWIHPNTAPAKAQHILCSADPAKAFDDVYLKRASATERCPEAVERLEVHDTVSTQWRVNGTPTLVLDGSPVTGFRKEVVANFLASKSKESLK